jgi:hypothetical protein
MCARTFDMQILRLLILRLLQETWSKSLRAAWNQRVVLLGFLLWLPAVGMGVRILWSYSSTPGVPAHPPHAWPEATTIHRASNRPAILVFAHLQCPCTSATVGQLALIMARVQGKADAYVLLYAPESAGRQETHNQLRRDAEAIPGVQVIDDVNGVESRRFGAATSGQALLYGASGSLLFNGGITASRGHAGDNYGQDAVVSLIESGQASHRATPVFGCSLLGGQ